MRENDKYNDIVNTKLDEYNNLICNSHLDPVWQWDWDEGAAAALATFYSAVRLAEKYDYIFCHNFVQSNCCLEQQRQGTEIGIPAVWV